MSRTTISCGDVWARVSPIGRSRWVVRFGEGPGFEEGMPTRRSHEAALKCARRGVRKRAELAARRTIVLTEESA